jgi:hypothetical protein
LTHHSAQSSAKSKAKSNTKSKTSKKKTKKIVKGKSKRSRRHHGKVSYNIVAEQSPDATGENQIRNPRQMIALNNEKTRLTDSVHKVTITKSTNEDKEGYFASFFASQKKAASFQTIEGTAAVFKSISGWDDKKFYVLTNLLPVGTIVRITTPDLKSICAKVINALPEVGNSVQYRLNDAAAAILGITNKTFPVSVTY